MAESRTPSALVGQEWANQFYFEYIRRFPYRKYFGAPGDFSERAMVQINEDLNRDLTAQGADTFTFARLDQITDRGFTGNQRMAGNEPDLQQRSFSVTVDYVRQGVATTKRERKFNGVGDPLGAYRNALQRWDAVELRRRFHEAWLSIDGVNYEDATAAQRNTWHDNNADRVLYGAATSNHSAGDHATSLGNVDSSNDTMDAAIVSLARRMARNADPIIPPYIVNDMEEWYILFLPSNLMRDLKADSTFSQAARDARSRGDDNPIFRDAAWIYDGVIIKEIPEIHDDLVEGLTLDTAGASSISVAPAFLCGAQSLAYAIAQRPMPVENLEDYDFRNGVGIESAYEVAKFYYGTGGADTTTPKDGGTMTIFAANVDS